MSHEHDHQGAPDGPYGREFWEERYRSEPCIWSGRPNQQLVEEAGDLPPGSAADIACGEGGDALWLATRGWRVAAVDVAAAALVRVDAATAAAGAAVAARVRTVRSDIADWDCGAEQYDLVTSHFLDLLPEVRGQAFARMAGAVGPGGTLLVVAHHPSDLETTVGRPHLPELFFTPDEVAGPLDPAEWTVLVAEARPRAAVDPEGRDIVIRDTVVRARRRG